MIRILRGLRVAVIGIVAACSAMIHLRLIVLLVTVALPLRGQAQVPAVPSAELSDEQRARTYFELGRSHFTLGEFDAAIEEFESGYRLKPLPLFLYNIALAARKAGKREMAIDYYQKYLDSEELRSAPELASARQQLDVLRREAAEQAVGPVAPPPKIETTTASRPVVVTPAVSAATSPRVTRPHWKRAWLWSTIGAVVVVGAGVGVGLGLGLNRSPQYPSSPLGTFGFMP